jgi:hypothetical protein
MYLYIYIYIYIMPIVITKHVVGTANPGLR